LKEPVGGAAADSDMTDETSFSSA